MKNSSIEKILQAIEEKTEFYFLYNNKLIDVDRKTDFLANKESIVPILSRLFNTEDIEFEVKGVQIILHPTGMNRNSSYLNTYIQQKKNITGRVTDEQGNPIIGANILEKGDVSNGIITDVNGRFTLQVKENTDIRVSYIGYLDQVISTKGKTSFDIILQEDLRLLEEVVVVGYGVQKKGNLTGSISNVKSETLTIAPMSNISNALVGHVPGLISKQNSGLPGSDMAILSIRGFGSALVIVDGIETNLNNIDVNQIESVSILKDGAASIYGARAGNGVILVTTKRGKDQKPTINLNLSYTLQGITKMLEPASSGERSEMEREAYLQSGKPEENAPWTEEAIAKFYAGNDPSYPNTDWFNYVFRRWAPQQNHNLSIRGGGEKIKYYGFLGYTKQETMIKKSGGEYKRYNGQSNIDAIINKNLNITIDVSMAFEDRLFPIRGLYNGGYLWNDLYNTRPWYPAELPDSSKISWGGIDVGSIATVSNIDLMGYNSSENLDLRGNISLNYDFSKIKGLKARAFANYYNNQIYSKNLDKPIVFYTYNPNNEEYSQVGSFSNSNLAEYINRSNILTQQYSLTYNNVFKDIHRLSALALFESIDYYSNYFYASRRDLLTTSIDQLFIGSANGMGNSGSASEMGRKSYVFRLNYSLMDRYLIETILRADASAKFPEDKRWGYFPSVSLGWVITQEKFMKNKSSFDNLKLRISYGQSGYDGVGNFQYLSGYSVSGTAILDDEPESGIYSTGLANPYLTWERITLFNVGLDFSILKKIYGTGEVFYRKRNGIPATRVTSLPTTFGASLPPENLNSIDNRGFELNLGVSDKKGDFIYDISGNISWSRSRWIHYEEPVYTDPDQKRIYEISGQWTDRVMGYVSDGLFTDQNQINALGYIYTDLGDNSSLRPGDVIYKDLNNDGKLDWKDQTDIGKGTIPQWMYGFTLALKYKNFDINGLFQGAFGYNTLINFYMETSVKYDLRWTEQKNNPDAMVPRLGGAVTNFYISDYWYRKTSYLRLKTASLGYEVPKTLLKRVGVNKLRFYFSGTNILTFNSLKRYNIDPEVPSGITMAYPLQRTFSLGLEMSF